MTFPAQDSRTLWWSLLVVYAVLLTSLHMAMTFPFFLASFEKLAAFEAAEPFQHRAMVPAVVASVQWLLPVGDNLLFALCEVAAWVALLAVARYALEVFGVGRTETSRRVLAFTLVIPMALHLFVPNLVLDPLVQLQQGRLDVGTWRAQTLFYYPYDLPGALFTLALVTVMVQLARNPTRRRLGIYLGLFALATVNRETTVFLIPVFALVCYGRLGRQGLVLALALQSGLFFVIEGGLQWLFADNVNPKASVPGTHYESHLLANLALFLNPLYLLTFVARFCAGFHLPALLLRRYVDPLLFRATLLFGLALVGSALMFGRIQELRVVIEVVPLVWLCGVQAVAGWWVSPSERGTVVPRSLIPGAPSPVPGGDAVPVGGRSRTAVHRQPPADGEPPAKVPAHHRFQHQRCAPRTERQAPRAGHAGQS